MTNLLRTLSLIPLALALAACSSAPDGDAMSSMSGEVVYTRVGMHFEVQRGNYVAHSTNYTELQKHVPPGTKFTITSIDKKRITLRGEDDGTYLINYVPNHSMMPMAEWVEKCFGSAPVELPADLTEAEREAIGRGICREGMSRQAVFLAIGYPPKSTNPSEEDSTLTYEARRFVKRQVQFDDQGRVVSFGR